MEKKQFFIQVLFVWRLIILQNFAASLEVVKIAAAIILIVIVVPLNLSTMVK